MKKHGTNLIYWVILAALGIFLIIGHNVALNIVCKVIGVALLLAAVSGVYSWWKTKSKKPEAIARLIGSLAFFGLGLWILLATGDFISFINVALGFVIILSAALTLYRGIELMVVPCHFSFPVGEGMPAACNSFAIIPGVLPSRYLR
jgi:hypothetical protein